MNGWYPQENAALCDEVAHLEEKFLRAKEERRWVDGIKMVLDNWCVQRGLKHSSDFTQFFCTKTKWLIRVSIPFSFAGFYWSRCCSTSLCQRVRYCRRLARAHIHLCRLWHWPQVLQGLRACPVATTWCQWCQRGKMGRLKNQRRKGKSEAGKMEKRSVSAGIIRYEVKREIHFTRQPAPYFILFSCEWSVPKKMSKKRKLADGSRKLVQPIPLDSSGRPVFPIVLGGLTVYSLGEVSVWLPSLAILSLWSLILAGTHALAMLWQVQLSIRWWFNK